MAAWKIARTNISKWLTDKTRQDRHSLVAGDKMKKTKYLSIKSKSLNSFARKKWNISFLYEKLQQPPSLSKSHDNNHLFLLRWSIYYFKMSSNKCHSMWFSLSFFEFDKQKFPSNSLFAVNNKTKSSFFQKKYYRHFYPIFVYFCRARSSLSPL